MNAVEGRGEESSSEEFSVTALLENSSLRRQSKKQLVFFIGMNKDYINLGKWERVILRVNFFG